MAENFIIDEKTFCSFFNVNKEKFKIFDKNELGIINSLIIIMILFLLKKDSLRSKLESKSYFKLDIFNYYNFCNEEYLDKESIIFIFEFFTQSIEHIFGLNFNDILKVELEEVVNDLYKNHEKIVSKELIIILERNGYLIEIFNKI